MSNSLLDSANTPTPEPSCGKRLPISFSINKEKTKSPKPPKGKQIVESLTSFFTKYCLAKNWQKGIEQNGCETYTLEFGDKQFDNAPIEFIHSTLLYLGKLVGIDKTCFMHSLSFYYCSTARLNALCDDMALVLQTLEFHNDDKLWKYVYSFLYNIALYFEHISSFISGSMSVSVPLPPKDSICIKPKYGLDISALQTFLIRYSDPANWEQIESVSKQNTFTTFRFIFGEKSENRAIHSRISLIYSMTSYLLEVVGAHKSMISMMYILCKGIEAQIESFSAMWKVILDALQFHNDYKLWKYAYTFVYNLTSCSKRLQAYIGTKTTFRDAREYRIRLRAQGVACILASGYIKRVQQQMHNVPEQREEMKEELTPTPTLEANEASFSITDDDNVPSYAMDQATQTILLCIARFASAKNNDCVASDIVSAEKAIACATQTRDDMESKTSINTEEAHSTFDTEEEDATKTTTERQRKLTIKSPNLTTIEEECECECENDAAWHSLSG